MSPVQITRVIFCVFLDTDYDIYKEKMSELFQGECLLLGGPGSPPGPRLQKHDERFHHQPYNQCSRRTYYPLPVLIKFRPIVFECNRIWPNRIKCCLVRGNLVADMITLCYAPQGLLSVIRCSTFILSVPLGEAPCLASPMSVSSIPRRTGGPRDSAV